MLRRFLFILLAALLLSHTGCSSGGDGDSAPVSGNSPTNSSKGGCFTTISSVGGSNISISGKIEYEDKEYGLSGFTNNTTNYYKASRYAEVEIINSATSGAVASAFTNSSGIYRISSSGFINVTSAYLRVISNTTANTSGKPSIEIHDLSGNLYAVSCDSTFVPQAGTSVTTNLSIPTSNEAAGAFNLMDVFTSGGEFIKSLAGANPTLLTLLSAYWEVGNSYGTWYCSGAGDPLCPQGEGIYVLNEASGDTDEYDDDVLWHEYGHFIAAKLSKDDSPGGYHSLSDNYLDLRLAWSEGWGDFFPTAVKAWLNSTNPALLSAVSSMPLSQYIDTTGNAVYISFDFGNNSGDPFIYSSNEVAVANVLWKMRNVFGMQSIWDIITSVYFKGFTPRVNLEAFWDAWLQRPTAGSEMATLQSILSSRSIFYSQDSFESQGDNSLTTTRSKFTVSTTSTEDHTIYNSGDIDYVPFDAVSGQSYTITTSNLKNGADTFIMLYNPDQTYTGLSNDNASNLLYTNSVPNNCDQWGICHENGYDILGSQIGFTASVTGTYFVGAASSSDRPLSAGRYGTYSLKITNQQ